MSGIPEQLQELRALGYAVVPGNANKVPLVRWKQWTERPQTDEEFAALPHGSVYGIVTGRLYGLVVLDFDGGAVDLAVGLKLAPNTGTGSGGCHVWVAAPSYPVKTCAAAFVPGLDVRGEGGLVWCLGRSRKGEYRLQHTHLTPATETLRRYLPEKTEQASSIEHAEFTGESTKSALRVLNAEYDRIVNAEIGTSNAVFNKAVNAVAGLCAAGKLDPVEAERFLMSAAEARGVGTPEAVFASAWSAGYAKPWDPDPPSGWKVAGRAGQAAAAPGPVRPAPEFPLEVFPEDVAEFVRASALGAGSSVGYVAGPMLAAVGVATHGTWVDVLPSWRERATIWIAVVGGPSTHKSPAIKAALAPVNQAHIGITEQEDLTLKDTSPRQIITSDATLEGLHLALEKNTLGMLFLADELIGLVKGFGQYKGGGGNDRQHWLSLWASEDITINRAKGVRVRIIKDPFISAAGGLQPDVLGHLLNDMDDGLPARLMLVPWTPAPEGSKMTLSQLRRATAPDRGPWARHWGAINSADLTGLHLTDEAFEVFDPWYAGWEETMEAGSLRYPGAYGKMSAYCVRFAIVLAQLRKPGTLEILPTDVEGAIKLVDYFYASAEHLYGSADALTDYERRDSGRREKLVSYLEEHPEAVRRDVQRHFKWAQSRYLDDMVRDLDRLDLLATR